MAVQYEDLERRAALLSVRLDAPPEVIKAAGKARLVRCHPDLASDGVERRRREEESKTITEAVEVLCDPRYELLRLKRPDPTQTVRPTTSPPRNAATTRRPDNDDRFQVRINVVNGVVMPPWIESTGRGRVRSWPTSRAADSHREPVRTLRPGRAPLGAVVVVMLLASGALPMLAWLWEVASGALWFEDYTYLGRADGSYLPLCWLAYTGVTLFHLRRQRRGGWLLVGALAFLVPVWGPLAALTGAGLLLLRPAPAPPQ
jgi:hypothetical protein